MNFWGLGLALAGLDWLALWEGWRRLDYLAKPGVILALLAWIGLEAAGSGGGLLRWFAAGLVFSLAGDILLMLPRERFVGGLSAFLFAHLAYTIGLDPLGSPWGAASLAALLVVGGFSLALFRRIHSSLLATGRETLVGPVLAYSLAISAMLITAVLTLTREDWSRPAAFLISVGAILFYASDVLLAWNRFVAPLFRGQLKVRVLYQLGQIALATGVVWHSQV